MNCCKCGTRIEDDCVFCPHCGTKQTPVNSAPSNNWFSPANNLDDSPVAAKKYTPPAEPVVASSFIKPVKGVGSPSTPKSHTPAPTTSHAEHGEPKKTSLVKGVEPAKPISKPITPKTDGGMLSKVWSKYNTALYCLYRAEGNANAGYR